MSLVIQIHLHSFLFCLDEYHTMKSSVLLALVSALAVTARPSFSLRAASPDVVLKNGQDAIALKYVSKNLSRTSFPI